MTLKKTIKKRKKKTLFTCQKKKRTMDSELARLIREATTQAFECKKRLNKKTSIQKGQNNKQNSPSISTNCTKQTITDTMLDDSTTPSISSRDSQNDGTNSSRYNNEELSESHSSKCMDSEFDSDDNKKDEILSLNVGCTLKKGRYKVQRKLDCGAFSTVWLAWDQQDKKYVALKIQNCTRDCIKAAQEEIKIHKEVVAGKPVGEKVVVKLLDHFNHIAPHNRKHVCMVFEYLGDNLLTLIKASKYKGIPLDMVKNLAKQILTGLNYLHNDLKIIHADLKPENILLMSTLDPRNDPRVSLKETSMPTKRQRFPTPAPPKVQKKLKSFHVENLSNNSHQHNSLGENLSQPTSQVGSRPTTPSPNKKNENNSQDEVIDTKRQVDEGHLSSEPESLDRLAIDSDPDIARNIDLNEKTKKTSSGGSQHQVKFSTPCKGKKSKQNDLLGSLNIDIRCKIVDLGTSCWTNKVLTDDIQTRPYRCPEVLLGCKYSTSADMWSFGCLIFELATGNILFDPRTGGNDYNRDEDHLAQIVEILGPIPKSLVSKGIHSHDYLTKDGELKHRKPRSHYPLYKLLVSEYRFNETDAKELVEFLLPLLELIPNKRPTAIQCLDHPWLKTACSK
jgi:serine/threonine-protein kinase SRPK3